MVVMISLIAIVSCQQSVKNDGADNSGAVQKDKVVVKTVLATNKDLACGMSVTSDVTDTAHYKGKVYGFCSPDCKKGFQSDPETYLAQ